VPTVVTGAVPFDPGIVRPGVGDAVTIRNDRGNAYPLAVPQTFQAGNNVGSVTLANRASSQ
jgi:hypothetical protein